MRFTKDRIAWPARSISIITFEREYFPSSVLVCNFIKEYKFIKYAIVVAYSSFRRHEYISGCLVRIGAGPRPWPAENTRTSRPDPSCLRLWKCELLFSDVAFLVLDTDQTLRRSGRCVISLQTHCFICILPHITFEDEYFPISACWVRDNHVGTTSRATAQSVHRAETHPAPML